MEFLQIRVGIDVKLDRNEVGNKREMESAGTDVCKFLSRCRSLVHYCPVYMPFIGVCFCVACVTAIHISRRSRRGDGGGRRSRQAALLEPLHGDRRAFERRDAADQQGLRVLRRTVP